MNIQVPGMNLYFEARTSKYIRAKGLPAYMHHRPHAPTDLRRDEKLRETVQRPPEVVRTHVEKVDRILGVGVRVAGPSVRAQERGVTVASAGRETQDQNRFVGSDRVGGADQQRKGQGCWGYRARVRVRVRLG